MCVSCGCGVSDDDHGDARNITLSDLRAAASAAQITMMQLSENLHHGMSLGSARTDELTADVESMNQPLPDGQFANRLESTPYSE
jgi:hypothetical protein